MASIATNLENVTLVLHVGTLSGIKRKQSILVSPSMKGREVHENIIGALGITAETISVFAKGRIIRASEAPLSKYEFFKAGSVLQVVVSLKTRPLKLKEPKGREEALGLIPEILLGAMIFQELAGGFFGGMR
jgi:hypothetical protein